MTKLTLRALLLLVPFMLSWTTSPDVYKMQIQPAPSGTYQLIQYAKMREYFTVETMDSLRVVFETLRNDTVDIIHIVSPYTKARILSRATIEGGDYLPLDECELIEQ